MQEIAGQVAMQKAQHVWFDGSLRDGEWYSMVFERIRNEFPNYRIAIIYVFASEEKVRERARVRGERTGRVIPEQMLMESLREPIHSLGILTPLCDFLARINNNGSTPVLEAVEVLDRSQCWTVIQKRLARAEADCADFPHFLMPLCVTPSDSLRENARLVCSSCGKPDMQHFVATSLAQHRTDLVLSVEDVDLGDFTTQVSGREWHLIGSPLNAVTLPTLQREEAGIPANAVFYCFIYPSVGALAKTSTDGGERDRKKSTCKSRAKRGASTCFTGYTAPKTRSSSGGKRIASVASLENPPGERFLTHGGFGYFDEEGDTVGINVASPSFESCMVQFGPARDVPQPVVETLSKQNRWCPFVSSRQNFLGVRAFCYVAPSEVIDAMVFPRHGGFVFDLTDSENAVLFPVTS